MLARMAILFSFAVGISSLHAAEVTCLCPVAMRTVLGDLGPQFESKSGHKLVIEYVTLGAANQRVAKGEAADVAVVLPRQAEELEKQGKLVPGTRLELARAGYGVVVRKGASRPDTSSVEALKDALLKAKSISYGDPSGGGPAGIYVAGLIDRLGLAAEMKAKTKLVQNAEMVVPAVAKGDAEIGFTLSSSASAGGLDFAPLPAEVQNHTIYVAGITAGSKQVDAAKAFIAFLSTSASREALRAKGFETR